jgi:hydroxymethylbilane synthase
MSPTLRIGSRGSALALIQSHWVRDQLQARQPGLDVEVVVLHTKGDKLLDTPLANIGDKGLFVKELEEALLDHRVDLAVHSAKDMPTETPAGLDIAAFTAREDVRDVFVAHPRHTSFEGLDDLPEGAVVGTSSLRRRSQLLALRPDLEVVDVRGNVETRMRKIEEQDMTGTVLAAAGLARLGRAGAAAFSFTFDRFLPAVGQGSLAIEARAGDEKVTAALGPLAHEPSALAVRAERALMRTLQGGCQVPIAAYGELLNGGSVRARLRLQAYVGSVDGADRVRLEQSGPASAPEELGGRLAAELREAGADRILAVVRRQTAGA